MEELSKSVALNASILAAEIQEKGLPPLDDELFPVSFPLLSPAGSHARFELISAALNIVRLASGPSEFLGNIGLQGFELNTIGTMIKLGVPQRIPLGGSVSLSSLAEHAQVEEGLFTRLVRYSISSGFLSEKTPGQISHNSASSVCVRDPKTTDSLISNINVANPASVKMVESLKLNPAGNDGTKAPLSLAFPRHSADGVEQLGSMWDFLREHPEEEVRFHNSMAATYSSSIYSCEHVVRGFDWAQVKTIVDVGGSEGHVSMAIVNSYPHIKSTVQDLGEVVVTSRQELPAQYNQAIDFVEHDFFQPQPVQADAYVMRFILHNWSDEDAKRIIRGLMPVLKPGVRVLVCEHVIPEKGTVSLYADRIVRNMDVTMFGLLAGKERTAQDYADLLGNVDPRLKLKGNKCPGGSVMTILEFVVE
ncbi:O-methyltransferase [Arthroderma uncinatum]|uniref:O-methyltransferase n=1 Tax=Arthroderma uncinatum TaxID=74035 RepID=UPI00144AF1A5|nr:O-methyltransferase [Arthroderma uncinatum]KAF3481935.1 O-methyltransferase [Arthroderma uncinatum]